jgi:hypothetical protein
MIAIVDPMQADAVVAGEGHASVVAVLRAAAKKPLDPATHEAGRTCRR